VLAACETIAEYMSPGAIVVTESTVPVGTTARLREFLQERTTVPFEVASCPQFLKEGNAVVDFLKPDRVVIGVDNPQMGGKLKELYEPFVCTGKPLLIMNLRRVSALCERVGADIEQIRRAIGAAAASAHSSSSRA